MRTRSTLLLMLLAAGLGVVLWKSDKLLPAPAGKPQNPLPFDASKIMRIEVEATEGSISLQVEDRAWRVKKPFDDMADPEHVTALLTALDGLEWLDEFKREDMSPAAWDLTGLTSPAVHLALHADGGDVTECWLGHASAIEGSYYLAVPNREAKAGTDARRCFVVRTDLPKLLKKPVESWRDDHLLRVPEGSVSKLVLSSAQGQIEIARENPKAPWRLVKPLQTRAHSERVKALLTAVLDLKITGITPAASATAAVTAPDALTIAVHTPAFSKPVEITLQPPADPKAGKTQARASHRPPSFGVSSEKLALLWTKLNDLRDDHLVRVNVANITTFGIRSGATGEVALKKEPIGGNWLLNARDSWEPANSDRLEKMFNALNEQRVLEFVADSASDLQRYGLDKPLLTAGWTEETPDPKAPQPPPGGAPAVISTDSVLLIGLDAERNVYAKYEDEPYIYRVDASVADAFPRANVKWKSLVPLRFTQFALLRLVVSVGTRPPLVLDYHPVTAVWKASVAGQDFTSRLNRVWADRLAGRLGSIVVDDWVTDRTEPAKLLQSPEITVHITLLKEAGNMNSGMKEVELNFAPTVPGQKKTAFYYGRVGGSPDIFLISYGALFDALGQGASVFGIQAPQGGQ